MLNLLFADDNIEYIKNISNLVLCQNDEVRLVKIANDAKETLQCIKDCRIDLIFLDLMMPFGGGWKILDMLNREDYIAEKPKIIIISGNIKLALETKDKYDVQDVILKSYGFDAVIKRINKNINELCMLKNTEEYKKRAYEELVNLKYNVKHNGTKYIMESIAFIINNKNYNILLENLEKNVYPIIANWHKKTPGNIKSNIVKATNNMYNDCNMEYLLKYFQYNDDIKPTPKVVISTIINKVIK